MNNGFKRIRFRKKREVPGDLWIKCPSCSHTVWKKNVEQNHQVCPECDFHFEIPATKRLELLIDDGSFSPINTHLKPLDPLQFKARRSYRERLDQAQELTGFNDACVTGTATIVGVPVVIGASDSRFLRGSMGSVVGEMITRSVELATSSNRPFIFVSGSGGGARMDEGALSLMQMAKTSAALARFDEAGGLFVSVLTNPTMGGCMASFAALGDVIIAEPKALLGFAGPDVIRQTIRAELPDGFQTSEFLLAHGFLDLIVHRRDLRDKIAQILRYCAPRLPVPGSAVATV